MVILSLLLFMPLMAVPLIAWMPERYSHTLKYLHLGLCLLQSIIGIGLIFSHPETLKAEADWITLSAGNAGILSMKYSLVLDGLNRMMVLLAAIILPLAALSSFVIRQEEKSYYALMLLLNTTLYGCFLAGDFFLFFLFFEAMLLPMYFLIGRWGGARKEYASLKFFLYTLAGSVFILVVLLAIGFSTFDMVATAANMGIQNAVESPSLAQHIRSLIQSGQVSGEQIVLSFKFPSAAMIGANGEVMNLIPGSLLDKGQLIVGMDARLLAFLFLFIGFAVKLPAVPLHTWLPDAHVEAPTPVSVILAALLLKIGAYGLIRAGYGYFPDAAFHWGFLVASVGVVSILYAALAALAQKDLKKMIAYSSISHMGFVLLGLGAWNATGLNGAILQCFNHGILSAMLFLLAGVLYDRTHNRNLNEYQGLWTKMPAYTGFVLLAFFASLGLPGLNAFVSEFLTLSSAFSSRLIPLGWSIAAVIGIVLGAAYFLRAFQHSFMGKYHLPHHPEYDGLLTELSRREWILLTVPALFALAGGIRPDWFTGLYTEEVAAWFRVLTLTQP